MAISPDKEKEPTPCCDADTELDLEIRSENGIYIVRETCTDCGTQLRSDDNDL